MVRASGQVGSDAAALECGTGSSQRAAHRATGTLSHTRTPRKTNFSLCRWTQSAIEHGMHVFRRVNQAKFVSSYG